MECLTSKEVAEMVGKRHDNFLRDLRKYIDDLGEKASQYFTQGSYKDTAGRERLGFNITKAGCELIASKLPLKKGEPFREKINAMEWDEVKPVEPQLREVDDTYSIKEAADILGITERSVYRRIEAGKLSAVEIPMVTMVKAIPKAQVEAYKEVV